MTIDIDSLVKKLKSAKNNKFIAPHSRYMTDETNSLVRDYKLYDIPQSKYKYEQADIDNDIIYGTIEVIHLHHLLADEWEEDAGLDSDIGNKNHILYNDISLKLTKKYNKPIIIGSFDEADEIPFDNELRKFLTGERSDITIWYSVSEYCTYYLVNSSNSGDGDVYFTLWVCRISDPD